MPLAVGWCQFVTVGHLRLDRLFGHFENLPLDVAVRHKMSPLVLAATLVWLNRDPTNPTI
jgi:hypothetical protein